MCFPLAALYITVNEMQSPNQLYPKLNHSDEIVLFLKQCYLGPGFFAERAYIYC